MRLVNRRPARMGLLMSAILPFVFALIFYSVASGVRLAENPNDKLLPSFASIGSAIERVAFQPDRRSGDYIFWKDTSASLSRLIIGVGIAAVIALAVGIPNGMLPWFGAVWSPVVKVLSMIPPLAILPILFILFGVGETAKIVLIAIGTAPFLMRDMEQRVLELPKEQLIKAQTLNANSWQIATRVVVPQVFPRLLDGLRLSLGSAWLFLIAAEAIASTEGLGYRIFLVRRYLSMDVILPYVVWIAVLAFAFDFSLRRLNEWLFPWYGSNNS